MADYLIKLPEKDPSFRFEPVVGACRLIDFGGKGVDPTKSWARAFPPGFANLLLAVLGFLGGLLFACERDIGNFRKKRKKM